MSDDKGDKGDTSKGLACEGDNYVIPGPKLPDGTQLAVHHQGDHTVSHGVIVPNKDGVSLGDDAMILREREGSPLLDVVGTVGEMRKGPSQVATEAYRRGWDGVFGKPDRNLN